jgi:hypothetical protein
MDNMEYKLKLLEMTQSVIARMAQNSFALKGWAITILSAMFILSEKDAEISFGWIGLAVAVIFWLLDAYYLKLERDFRAKYDEICDSNDEFLSFKLSRPKKTCFVSIVEYFKSFIAIHNSLFYIMLVAISCIVSLKCV